VRPHLNMFDVLALPSHREGFGMVILEAAAFGVPSVAYDVTGCRDAVLDGITGTLVPLMDAPSMASALCGYLSDPPLRRRHGAAARERARQVYQPNRVWGAYAAALAS